MSRKRRGPTPKKGSARSFWGTAGAVPATPPADHECAICTALAAGDSDAALALFLASPDLEWED